MAVMELRLLKTFDAVATLLSFNRAAQLLHCTQSTVSSQIKQLEEDLGAALFLRLGRRIALTPAGEELWGRAKKLLAEEQALYESVRSRGAISGRLTLRVPQSVAELYLPPILARFAERHPCVGFDISTCGYFRLADELRAGEVDLAFLYGDCLSSAELCHVALRREALVYVVGPKDPLARRKRLNDAILDGRTLLLPKHDCGYRMDLERRLFEAGIRPKALIEMNSVQAVKACVEVGLGTALLPRAIVEKEIREGKLAALSWQSPIEVGLHLICHRDRKRIGPFGDLLRTIENAFPRVHA